jgi:hypothetical protein
LSNFRNTHRSKLLFLDMNSSRLYLHNTTYLYTVWIIWIEVYVHIQDRTIWLLIEQLGIKVMMNDGRWRYPFRPIPMLTSCPVCMLHQMYILAVTSVSQGSLLTYYLILSSIYYMISHKLRRSTCWQFIIKSVSIILKLTIFKLCIKI